MCAVEKENKKPQVVVEKKTGKKEIAYDENSSEGEVEKKVLSSKKEEACMESWELIKNCCQGELENHVGKKPDSQLSPQSNGPELTATGATTTQTQAH